MKKTQRRPWRLPGDRIFLFNTFLVIMSMVLVAGVIILVTNIGVVVKTTQAFDSNILLAPLTKKIVFNSILSLAVIFLLSLGMVVVYIQKVAGPLYRLQMALEMWFKKGDLKQPLHFRKDDQFQNLGKTINSFRAHFLKKIEKESKKVARVEKGLSALVKQLSTRNGHRVPAAPLAHKLKSLEKHLKSRKI